MSDKKISQLTVATTPLAGTEVLPIVQSGATVKVPVSSLTAGRAVAMLSSSVGPNAIAVSGAVVDAGFDRNSPTRLGVSNQNSGASAVAGIDFEAAGGGWQLDVPPDVSTFANPLIGKFNGTEKFRFKADGSLAFIASAGIDFSATTEGSGTMTSELLDDYEEGTFTPVVADAATGGNVAASATTSGIYTKVGNVVTVQFQASSINTTGMTAGNILYFRGLPFTNNAAQVANGVTDMRSTAFTDYPTVFLGTSSAAAMLFMHASGAGVSQVLVSDVTGSSLFFITLTYTV
jgi:hypothetical protein